MNGRAVTVAPQAVKGLVGGTQVETNIAEFSAESHGVYCSGDHKVLTELQIAIRSKILFLTFKSQENREDELNTVSCYKELFQTSGDGQSSSLVFTTCYYDFEQSIWSRSHDC